MSTPEAFYEQLAAAGAHRAARLASVRASNAYRDAAWAGVPAKTAAALAAKNEAEEALRLAGLRSSAAFGVKVTS